MVLLILLKRVALYEGHWQCDRWAGVVNSAASATAPSNTNIHNILFLEDVQYHNMYGLLRSVQCGAVIAKIC